MDLKKTSKAIVVVAVMIAFTVGLAAQAPRADFKGKAMRQGRGMMGPGVTGIYRVLQANREELNIADTQLEKIKGIMLAFEETKVKTQNEINTRQLEMKKLMMADKKDYKKIKSVLSGISDARHDMMITGMKIRDDIKNILTPEQQEALKKLLGRRMGGRRFIQRGPRGLRGPGPQGPMRDRMQERFPKRSATAPHDAAQR